MRHNDARKWLHAVLDLLPVLLIPVFMIYSHRHTMTEQTTVDIQYKYQSNDVNSVNDLIVGNIYEFQLYNLTLNDVLDNGESLFFQILTTLEIEVDDLTNSALNEAVITEFTPDKFLLFSGEYISIYESIEQFEDYDYSVEYNYNGSFLNNCIIRLFDYDLQNSSLITYTDYNIIESVDVHDETSSVMNVFMDNFNGAIDKYFNMGNVFNLTGVYQWFNANIFNGNAPTIIYSVWNIALYELVMDLLFLLYGLFMWFIDMCKHLMEKPFRSIK